MDSYGCFDCWTYGEDRMGFHKEMNTTCPQCKTAVLKEHHHKTDGFFVTLYFVCPHCSMEFDEQMEKLAMRLGENG